MGFLSDIFGGGGSNPANAAMPYLNQIPGMLSQYYQPYINLGQQGMNLIAPYQQQLMQLMQNPTGVMNQIGQNFQQSPGYQWQVDQATRAANQAAAAGGMAGSPSSQYNVANTVNQMANQDYYNYLNHGLGMYNQGLSGTGNLAQYLTQLGYGASTGLAGDLASNLMNQANLAYSGQANQNQMGQGMFGALLGAGTGLLSGYLGGGKSQAGAGAGAGAGNQGYISDFAQYIPYIMSLM